MPTEDGQNFLLNQLDKLTVLEDSVLGKFLQEKLGRRENKKVIIFPFETNSSQRLAVKRALEEDLSVIQGPPGTGKPKRFVISWQITLQGAAALPLFQGITRRQETLRINLNRPALVI